MTDPTVTRLFGVYNAGGTVRGELSYLIGSQLIAEPPESWAAADPDTFHPRSTR